MAEEVRVTQQGLEVTVTGDAEERVTQQGVEIAQVDATPIPFRVTQQGADIAALKDPPPFRVTQQGLDIAVLIGEECTPVDGRIITTPLNDETLRPQFLGHTMIVEVTEDPLSVDEDNATWTVQETGICTRATLVDALTWEFTLGDTDRKERDAKLFAGPDLLVGEPSHLLGGPVEGGFGEVPDLGRPIFRVSDVEADEFIVLRYVQGPLPLSFATWLESLFGPLIAQFYLNNIAQPFAQPTGDYSSFGRGFSFPQIVVQLYDPTTGDLVATGFGAIRMVAGQFTPLSKQILRRVRGGDDRGQGPGTSDKLFDVGLEFAIDWATNQPAADTRYHVAMYVAQATDLTPFHFDGHPVDIATAIYDALGIEYDPLSAEDTKALLGPSVRMLLRPTREETALEVLEKWLQGPAGFAYRIVEGVRIFYPTRYRDSTTPAVTLTIDSLRGEGTPYHLSDQNVVTRVVWEEEAFLFWDESLDIPLDDRPLDGLIARPSNHTQRQQDSNAADYLGEQVYRYPGMLLGPYPVEPGQESIYKQQIAEEIFFRWGRGGAELTFPLLPGFAPLVGEFVVNTLEYSPIPEAGQHLITVRPKDYPSRSPRQVLQVTKRSDSPAGPECVFQVVGPVADDVTDATGFLVTPTITIAAAAAKPRNVAAVTVTNWSTISATSGNRVEMQWNTGSVEPLSWNSAGSLMGGTAGIIGTPILPAGSHVWARARTWNLDGRFSAWSSVVDLDLDDLLPPEDFVGTRVGDTLAFVFTWTNGANGTPGEPIVMRFAKGLDQEFTEIGVFPAGTTRFEYAFEEANVSYRVEIFHRQVEPVLSESAHVEITVTTGTTLPELDPPTNPTATTNGLGSITMCVDIGDVDADSTVFQYAEEQSDGSFGAWITWAIEPHAGGRLCSILTVPQEQSVFNPDRNKYFQVQAFHRALGFTDSDPTSTFTVDPWQVELPLDLEQLYNYSGDPLANYSGVSLEGVA